MVKSRLPTTMTEQQPAPSRFFHSMGGPVIRQYAIRYPEHVAGLVAVDGQLDLRGLPDLGGLAALVTPETREVMIRSMFVPETPVELQEHILEMMLGAPAETARGAMSAMFDPAIRTDDVIEAPALAVIAGTGQVPDVDVVREIVPEFSAIRLDGTGHFLMMEKPAEFNQILTEFLEEIDF